MVKHISKKVDKKLNQRKIKSGNSNPKFWKTIIYNAELAILFGLALFIGHSPLKGKQKDH